MFPWEQVVVDNGEEVAWRIWNGPDYVWRQLPTFVIFEWVVLLVSFLGLLHAVNQQGNRGRRSHLFLWVCSFVAGCANDMFFMALPIVDNFWQAQATIMLTPRLPLYIPAIYNCFMYYSIVAAWRMGFVTSTNSRSGYFKEAALAGLLAELFYAAYDICGAKFLWWTWHDTDAAIAERILGVPIGSSMWVITFVFCYSLLLRFVVMGPRHLAAEGNPISVSRLLFGLLVISVCCPPMMIITMTTFTGISSAGVPSIRALSLLLVVFLALVIVGFFFSPRSKPPHGKRGAFLWLAVLIYFTALALIMLYGVPEAHISRGVHQPIGPATTMMTDMLGYERRKYFDPSNYEEDFTFDCAHKLPRPGTDDDPLDWYTVCGKRHSDFLLYAAVVSGIAFTGVLTYTFALGLYSKKPEKRGTRHADKSD